MVALIDFQTNGEIVLAVKVIVVVRVTTRVMANVMVHVRIAATDTPMTNKTFEIIFCTR